MESQWTFFTFSPSNENIEKGDMYIMQKYLEKWDYLLCWELGSKGTNKHIHGIVNRQTKNLCRDLLNHIGYQPSKLEVQWKKYWKANGCKIGKHLRSVEYYIGYCRKEAQEYCTNMTSEMIQRGLSCYNDLALKDSHCSHINWKYNDIDTLLFQLLDLVEEPPFNKAKSYVLKAKELCMMLVVKGKMKLTIYQKINWHEFENLWKVALSGEEDMAKIYGRCFNERGSTCDTCKKEVYKLDDLFWLKCSRPNGDDPKGSI